MTTSEIAPIGTVIADRLAAVARLLAERPGCAVGVIGTAADIVDPAELFASFGISLDGHSILRGRAPASCTSST